MGVYFGLVLLILILPFLGIAWKDEGKRAGFSLIVFGIALFLVYVLRDFSVGRDIPGYCEVYETMYARALFDASWTWMEWGYVLLMKVCSMLGLSARAFLAVVYVIIEVPLLLFIKRCSKDVTLSLVVFMCFQFFVFSMSALRQTMAMSLCLMGYMAAQRNGLRPFLSYVFWLVLACLVHRSAIVFAPVYALMRWKLNIKMIIVYIVTVVFAVALKANIILGLRSDANEVESTTVQENLSIGAFFWFMMLVVAIAFVFSYVKYSRQKSPGIVKSLFSYGDSIPQTLSNHSNLLMCCLVLQYIFRGFMLMRAAVFYQVFLLLVIPEILEELPKQMKGAARILVIAGMVAIFYLATLSHNELDIVPYRLGILK